MAYKALLVFLAALVCINAQAPQTDEFPKPYNIDYTAHTDEGASSFHQAQADESGRVVGSYGLVDIDGRQRTVSYEADADGFRAVVRSNEPGLTNVDSADVHYEVAEAPGPVPQPQPVPVERPVPRPVLVRPPPERRPIAVVRPRPELRPAGGYLIGGPAPEYIYGRPAPAAGYYPGAYRFARPAGYDYPYYGFGRR